MRRFLPTRYELVHKFRTLRKTATLATRRNSRLTGSISRLVGIFAKNRLPGAITFPSELRFMQNLYLWKVNFSSFPTVSRMTHFEHQKASKSCLENRVKKLYRHANREGSAGGAMWQIRLPRGTRVAQPHHEPRSMTMCELPYKSVPPPLIPTSLARVLRQKLGVFWTETRERVLSLGF